MMMRSSYVPSEALLSVSPSIIFKVVTAVRLRLRLHLHHLWRRQLSTVNHIVQRSIQHFFIYVDALLVLNRAGQPHKEAVHAQFELIAGPCKNSHIDGAISIDLSIRLG